jgi:hypothetical protein
MVGQSPCKHSVRSCRWHPSVFLVSSWCSAFFLLWPPVRIRVRIDSPHPFVCRKRRLNGAVLRMRPENRSPVSQQVWQDKDPSPLKGPARQA